MIQHTLSGDVSWASASTIFLVQSEISSENSNNKILIKGFPKSLLGFSLQ